MAMRNDQQVEIRVSGQTATGAVDNQLSDIVWTLDNTAVATLTVASDSMSAILAGIAGSPDSALLVSVTATNRNGDPLFGSVSVDMATVVTPPTDVATALVLTVSDPVDQPVAPPV